MPAATYSIASLTFIILHKVNNTEGLGRNQMLTCLLFQVTSPCNLFWAEKVWALLKCCGGAISTI